MRTAQYVKAERGIIGADGSGIRVRWEYGLRLLRDPEKVFASGRLRKGAAERLIADTAKVGIEVSQREIQRRLQCAKAYPTESQLRHAVSHFPTWHDLVEARFPAFDPDPFDPPADIRTKAEREAEHRAHLVHLVGDQCHLFPLSLYEPADATLKDLIEYLNIEETIAELMTARNRNRREYLDKLMTAVDNDVSQTWLAAHRAAFGEDPTQDPTEDDDDEDPTEDDDES